MDTLWEVADSFSLELSISINLVSTQYADNFQDLNSVLNLTFLWVESEEFNNYIISPDLQSLSYHAPLLVSIILEKEFIQEKKQFIIRNSDKEKEFVSKLRNRLGSIAMTNIISCKILEYIIQEFASIVENPCNKFSKLVNITK